MVKVNLLPGLYLKRRRHNRRFRAAVLVGGVLLGAELVVGIIVHARAERTRSLYAAAEDNRLSILSAKKDLEEPKLEVDRLGREVHLAERLRTKHRWSRLLGTIGQVTPGRVLITTISTNPPQWTPGLVVVVADNERAAPAARENVRPILQGLRLLGQAIDHQDLATFMAAIHGTRAFAGLELKQARRERAKERESIMFELECPW
jgi:Tfp pilus assembly protein PilN